VRLKHAGAAALARRDRPDHGRAGGSISGSIFELPIWACLAVIALAAWLNVALRLRFSMTQRVEPDRAAWLLAFDISRKLAILLFLTGGLENPFCVPVFSARCCCPLPPLAARG